MLLITENQSRRDDIEMTIDPAEGHRLNGGEQSAGDAVLSASEMRLRRLAALEQTTLSQPAPPKYGIPAAAPSLLVDEDEDMQAAIAMSLHNTSEEEATASASSTSGGSSAQPPSDTSGTHYEEPFDVSTFHSVMWDDATTTDNDKTRWIQQGIDLRDKMNVDFATPPPASDSMLTLVGSNHGPWGLVQHHGGPCGVLAAVQAELLRLLLFGSRNPLEYPLEIPQETVSSPNTKTVADSLVREALAMSIAIIIARATLMPCAVEEDSCNSISNNKSAHIVLPSNATASGENDYTGLTWNHLYPADENEANLNVYSIPVPPVSKKRQKMNEETLSTDLLIPTEMRIVKLANAISKFLLQPLPGGTEHPLEYYRQAGGVLLLTMSLVASRGKDMILQDMDDNMCKFTSQFGHCSQELMNLLLTGQSVSNVFDNTLSPSGGLTLRGIQSRPVIGYLTQLEALRYCEVGGYYKSPRFPLWVVGSQSHFTVLFGEPNCLKESKSDILLEKCRRAFKSIQGAEENGYIPSDSLKEVLNKLEIRIDDDSQYSVLQAMVEMGGAGIVLWDDFWKVASRLLTGATLLSVLEREDESGGSDDSMPPLLLTNGELEGNEDAKPAAKSMGDYFKGPSAKGVSFAIQRGVGGEQVSAGQETDEEMARRLAEEWGASELNSPPAAVAASPSAAAARPPSPMEMDSALSADEQLARKLQAEDWESDAHISSTTSVDAVTDSPPPPLDGELRGEVLVEDSKLPATDSKMPSAVVTRKLDFERFGNSFRLYHYNGLRGGSLTPFRVTRLTAQEAVGASVPLTNTGGAGDKGMAASGDLEDVLRTKWPSCSIDWLGKSSPSID